MVDLYDPASVALHLDQALGWFADAGPLIPPGYLFHGQSSGIDKRQLPKGIVDLLDRTW